MNNRRLLLCASLWILTGCSDSGPSFLGGSVSFTYSGTVNGTFAAEGSALDAGDETQPWAIGARDESQQVLAVGAAMPVSGDAHHFAALQIPRLTAGTSTISANCTPTQTTHCAAAVFTFNASDAGGALFNCFLQTGTLVIASISSTRATGTFSGGGTCVDQSSNVTTFAVSSGTFDVSVVSGTL